MPIYSVLSYIIRFLQNNQKHIILYYHRSKRIILL